MKSAINLSTVIPAAFSKMRQGSTFLSVKGYINNYDEISNFGIVFNVDYVKTVKKSIDFWSNYLTSDRVEKFARDDLIESYSDTLRGFNPRNINVNTYRPISHENKIIKNVKWHDNGRAIHLWGFRVHKVVLQPGRYKTSNSSAFTAARNNLILLAPIGRFRQFKVAEGRFQSIGVENMTFTHHDLVRDLI